MTKTWRIIGAVAAMLIAAGGGARAAQPASEVLPLWSGTAPGTETWTGREVDSGPVRSDSKPGYLRIVTNVSVPTLTVVRPAPGTANGTAMVVAPGGGFQILAWDLEGLEVARWLADRGVTVFVLKYRVRVGGQKPGPQTKDPAVFAERARTLEPARLIAVSDAVQAIKLVRQNASRYGLAPDRIGMMGFSAGAMTTMGAVLQADPAGRPDFAAPIYGAMPEVAPGPDAPPLFIAAAQDDPTVPAAMSVKIFTAWTQAGRPAELHIFEKGGHGFGLGAGRGGGVEAWPQAFERWLSSRKLLNR